MDENEIRAAIAEMANQIYRKRMRSAFWFWGFDQGRRPGHRIVAELTSRGSQTLRRVKSNLRGSGRSLEGSPGRSRDVDRERSGPQYHLDR
jgi:hypothetical protein